MEVKIDVEAEEWGVKIDPSDTWNLDMTLAAVILPALKQFKIASEDQYPGDMESPETWQDILDSMIYAFEIHANPDTMMDAEYERAQKGLDLFAKHFGSLWI